MIHVILPKWMTSPQSDTLVIRILRASYPRNVDIQRDHASNISAECRIAASSLLVYQSPIQHSRAPPSSHLVVYMKTPSRSAAARPIQSNNARLLVQLALPYLGIFLDCSSTERASSGNSMARSPQVRNGIVSSLVMPTEASSPRIVMQRHALCPVRLGCTP